MTNPLSSIPSAQGDSTTTPTSDRTTTGTPVPSRHIPQIDALRGFACIWVLLHHVFLTTPIVFHSKIFKPFEWFVANGHYAVTLFIALSGFSLGLPITGNDWNLKGGARLFYTKRAIRILPPYWISIALSLILIQLYIGNKTGTHWDVSIPVGFQDIWAHAFLIPTGLTKPTINHVYWSIAVESHIYLLLPVVLYIRKKVGDWAALVSGGLLASLALVFRHAEPFLAQYILVFGFGLFTANLYILGRRYNPWYSTGTAAFGLVIYALFQRPEIRDLAAGLIASVIIYSFATYSVFSNNRLLKPLEVIGAFAYSVYLVHAPIIQVVYQAFFSKGYVTSVGSLAVFSAVCLAAGLVVSYAFYLLFERPFVILNSKYSKRATNPPG